MTDKPRQKILVLDFDGTIHSYTSGWQGAAVINDPPTPGALEFIRDAQRADFQVAIYSSRSALEGGLYAMQRWLVNAMREAWGPEECANVYGLVEWPQDKPAAWVTIDDRAIPFTGTWPDPNELHNFKPWNKA